MTIDIDNNTIGRLKSTIEQSERFIIVPHVNPDGDAIGSSLALCRVLQNLGKKAQVIIPNDYPEFLQWIEGSDQVIDYTKKSRQAKSWISKAEVLFFVDFNEIERSEGVKKA
jgi:phosphoesterase RecJ-like protein